MVNVKWKDQSDDKKTLYFRDLSPNQAFRNADAYAKGAVYIKVVDEDYEVMYEIATGKLWPATASPVELVDVSITIDTEKPSIY